MNNLDELREALSYVDPRHLNYQEWVEIGMGIKSAGGSAYLWDEWSQRDPDRYHDGECYKKWDTFEGTGITEKTLFRMAIDNGYQPVRDSYNGIKEALDYDSVIYDYQNQFSETIVDKTWLERETINEPVDEKWDRVSDIKRYLSAVFKPNEKFGYVMKSYKDDDEKWKPGGDGASDRTVSQVLAEFEKHSNDIGAVLGDPNKEAGVWIRFNPMDGKGSKNANVTNYRYTLIESDSIDIGTQLAIIKKLELPCAAIVSSGGKSIHAIVHIDAGNDLEEYKKRVERLYKICDKNGLKVDSQNKNPSRLSRMPGFYRNGKKQFLIDTNCGKANWDEWDEWFDNQSDDLPDPTNLSAIWDNLPEVSPELIHGVLRKGHKMMISGPSKAGKSFALIELTIAIAEGRKWLGMQCEQGKVLYVNLELDAPSCFKRFKDVYATMGIDRPNTNNVIIWNLRGKSSPMDKLAPKMIKRASKEGYIAVIIDPIYKVITGDENSAEQMAKFTNQFDKVATELNCAVIYCHHHSKGSQIGKKSMDRASGSGVFARDPDALLDIIELTPTKDIINKRKDKAVIDLYASLTRKYFPKLYSTLLPEDFNSAHAMALKVLNPLQEHFGERGIEVLREEAKEQIAQSTAWRMEYTLREFAKPEPLDMWFNYPVHTIDTDNDLARVIPESDMTSDERARSHVKSKDEKKADRQTKLELAYANLANEGKDVLVSDLELHLGIKKRTLAYWISESDGRYTKEKIEGKNEYKVVLHEL